MAKEKGLFKDMNFRLVASVTLMAVLGVASLTPVFPVIEKELNITPKQVSMLITLFTLPGMILTPFLGILADRYGRKKILLPALFIFGIFGGVCGFARSYHWLLIFRFMQGVGGASLNAINVTILGDLYTGNRRATAMGYNASILSIGTALYPAIGGLLATFAWFYPFFLPVLAIPIGILVLFKLKNPEPKNEQHFKDYIRAAFRLVKTKKILGIFILSVSTFILLYGSYLSYFPFLLERKFLTSSVIIGIVMSLMSLSTAIASAQVGRLSGKVSKRSILIVAFLLFAGVLTSIPFIPKLWIILVPVICFGFALGLTVPNLNTMLAEIVDQEYRGAMMSINGMVLRGGQTLGPVIMGWVYSMGNLNYPFWAGGALAILVAGMLYLSKISR